MRQAILKLPEQFTFNALIHQPEQFKPAHRMVVGGMGGSALPAELWQRLRPTTPLVVHRDYGLPTLDDNWWVSSLWVASSYSGQTEETLDFAAACQARGLNWLAIASGGRLLEVAKAARRPYIQLPAGWPPRLALGLGLRALASLMADDALDQEMVALAPQLKPAALEADGHDLATKLHGRVPIIYSSDLNRTLAYNWKIKFNETSKVPAWANVVPELNHNEWQGFAARPLGFQPHFIFIIDPDDHQRVRRRFEAMGVWLEKNNWPMTVITLSGETVLEKLFRNLILADWTALFLAEAGGVEPMPVPLIEEFKKSII